MAREHIVFLQAQWLSWQRTEYVDPALSVETKTLSRDPDTGAATTLVRYPPGWRTEGSLALSKQEEFLVIEGSIQIGDVLYGKHAYACFPAGYPRGAVQSESGAVVLSMLSGRPEILSYAREATYDPALLVRHVDPMDLEWDETLVDPKLAAGVAIKPLRTDPYTGEQSFLYCTRPHRKPKNMRKPRWTHPMIEEIYCLDGEYVFADCGRMGAGGYCFWRENIYHGPSGSDVGFHLFVRTINGALENEFSTDLYPFTWKPPFNPLLPDDLRRIARPYERPPNY